MKKVLFLFVASVLMLGNVMAQEVKYQRSSLHLIQLISEEPVTNDPALEEIVKDVWNKYPFPDKYNKHDIDVVATKVKASDKSMMATIKKINEVGVPTDVKTLKEYKEALTDGKASREELQAQIDEFIKKEDIARKLVMKWYNIQEDGSTNTDLITKRGAFNMNSSDVATAAATAGGAEAIVNEIADEMLNTTFVAFSMINFYQNEPIAAAIKGISIASVNSPIAAAAAQKAYDLTKDGYTAQATTWLYQLVWNDSIKAEFNNVYVKGSRGTKIDMDKFNALTFELKFLGDDKSTTTTLFSGDKSKEDIITSISIRNFDKQFVNLQKNHEVFRPVAPIICTNPLMADMGTKEGLKGGEKFEILTRTQDPKTGKMEYKSIGKVKVDKKGVWDNNFNMVNNEAEITPSPIQSPEGKNGTVLSANKKATVGMVVRQIK